MVPVLLVYPRSGSHFIMRILTGLPKIIDKDLLTEPKVQACIESYRTTVSLTKKPLDCNNYLFFEYAFETRSDLALFEQGALYTPKAISSLPFDRKFVYLIRDGRDQIESYWHMTHVSAASRGVFYPALVDDDIDYASNIFKARARRILDCSDQLNNYVYFRFEDLIASPLEVSSSIITALGLTPEVNAITNVIAQIIPNTSYRKTKLTTYRSKQWSQRHRDIFWSIAGEESLELGYSR